MPREPRDIVIEHSIENYKSKMRSHSPPYTKADRKQAAVEMMTEITAGIEAANVPLPASSKYRLPQDLTSQAVATLALHYDNFRNINFGYGNKDDDVLAVYIENGPDRGLYSTSEVDIKRCLRVYSPGMTEREYREIIDLLKGMAPHEPRCGNKDFIPVNNGIFDYKSKTLMSFSPEYVFVTKCIVDYVGKTKNPVISRPNADDWDVETWMQSLSDDPEIVDLLWKLIAATLRSAMPWDRVAMLYNTRGSGGKGTYCSLIGNILGEDSHISIQISDMNEQFGLERLIRATAIICDENDVGAYIERASKFKALATGDRVDIDRKYKTRISFQFRGMIIQCINALPTFRDKTDSLYRRLLMIPFDQCFTGHEKKYIKEEYLKREDVLQYVLGKVLNMKDFDELSEPDACKRLKDDCRESNRPMEQFIEDVVSECAWDLVPFTFLYDAYKSWSDKNTPSERVMSRSRFIHELEDILRDSSKWIFDKKTQYRIKNLMDKPEPLIAEYDLKDWYNQSYKGTDVDKRCTPCLSGKYRGLLRASVAANTDDDNDDSKDMDQPFES